MEVPKNLETALQKTNPGTGHQVLDLTFYWKTKEAVCLRPCKRVRKSDYYNLLLFIGKRQLKHA